MVHTDMLLDLAASGAGLSVIHLAATSAAAAPVVSAEVVTGHGLAIEDGRPE